MPATNELKHFNSKKVSEVFLKANGLTLAQKSPDLSQQMQTIEVAATVEFAQ